MIRYIEKRYSFHRVSNPKGKQGVSLISNGLHEIGNPAFSPLGLVSVKEFAPTKPCVNHQRDGTQQEI
jgi:hypothetical protein